MTTATIDQILETFAKMDPEVREGVWRVVAAIVGGGGLEAAIKETEIAVSLVAALKLEDSLPGSIGRV